MANQSAPIKKRLRLCLRSTDIWQQASNRREPKQRELRGCAGELVHGAQPGYLLALDLGGAR
uniref:Uncharacterized protein n=1 Tax=Fagus sylvatica TaxID=28930 RepID=A0A2N9IFR4_FAGSY